MELFIEKNKEIILTLLLALTAFCIVFHFTDTPRTWTDEGIFTNVSENIALNGVVGIQTNPGVYMKLGPLLSTNYPVFFSVALAFKLFGIGLWQARLSMIIYMFSLVILYYFFVKRRYGNYFGIMAVLLLISFAPFYGNGRPVQGEIAGLFFLVLGALFLLYFEESNFESKKFAIYCGLFLGLAAATKTLYLLLLLVALPLVLFFWYKKIQNKKNILILLGVFLIPIIIWFIFSFPTVDLIKKIIPTIIHQAGNNGASSLSNTSQSLIKTIFINLKRFVTEATPILFTLLFITILLSIIHEYFKKEKWNFSIAENLIFFVIVLNLGGYLLGTGWYRYFFPAHTLLYLLFPGAVFLLSKSFSNSYTRKFFIVFPILLIVFQFTHLIFFSDTSWVYTSMRNSQMSKAFREVSSTERVLFYNTIDQVVFLQGGNYTQYFTLPGLLEAGDKNSVQDLSNDYILIGRSDQMIEKIPSCYIKTEVSNYFLFKKTTNCKK
jgi:4-amino-4-deoxy-L-arabinose transferase-like glycosyltransferase